MANNVKYMSNILSKTIWILIFLLLQKATVASIEYSKNCKKAYEYALGFDFQKMDLELAKERKKNPNNVVVQSIQTYSYFLKFAISEDKKALAKFEDSYTDLVDKLENEDANNPLQRYLLTDLYFQSAFVNIFESNFLTALFRFKKAYGKIKENSEKFPDFALNNKALGLLNIGLGSIPKSYNWTLKLINMEGDMNLGYKQMQSFLELTQNDKSYEYLYVEGLLLYSFTQSNYSNKNSDSKILDNIYSSKSITSKYGNNQLFTFSKVSFYQHKKENEKALAALNIIQSEFETNPNKLFYLDYMFGESLLYKNLPNSTKYFKRYIKYYPGENYKRAAYQKIGWAAIIAGDNKTFNEQKQKILESGADLLDADKQAIKEAKSDESPNISLLKSRLLFDGGYYNEAITVLRQGFVDGDFESQRENLEYIYRLARIYDEMGNQVLAEIYYKMTIDKGRDLPYYFAANSALNLAYKYEEQKKTNEAIEMYQLCLDLEFDEYQNSITQKAKAGLSRLE